MCKLSMHLVAWNEMIMTTDGMKWVQIMHNLSLVYQAPVMQIHDSVITFKKVVMDKIEHSPELLK
jgi:hypothetical protein